MAITSSWLSLRAMAEGAFCAGCSRPPGRVDDRRFRSNRVGDIAHAASSLRELARPAAGDLPNGPDLHACVPDDGWRAALKPYDRPVG